MDAFQFLRPLWLLALPVGALLAWRLQRLAASPVAWRRVCDPLLLPHLLVDASGGAARWPYRALAIGWALAALALAGPSWDQQPQPVYRNLAGRVIVLDVSQSMDAADLAPSRLVQARFKVADLLNRPFDGQYGLVVFAGDAFTVAPLTHDVRTLRNLLPALDTNVVPVQGSGAARGLEQAAQLLAQSGVAGGQIILITDDSDPRTRATAARMRAQGIRTHVLGVGTAQGSPIPVADGGFLKDASGSIVLPRLDIAGLRELADAGGGGFATLTVDNADVAALMRAMERAPGLSSGAMTDTFLETEHFNDRGPWLVLVLLPLAALGFRRGWLTAVLLVCWATPPPAQALSWDALWWRADQRAARALTQGDTERAASEDAAPAWQGSALYRAGRYADAERAFSRGDESVSQYNRGNALAHAGELEQALTAYDAALAQHPEFADAVHNRELVLRALQQQPPPQSGGQNPEQSDPGEDSQSGSPQQGTGADSDPESAPADRPDSPSEEPGSAAQNGSQAPAPSRSTEEAAENGDAESSAAPPGDPPASTPAESTPSPDSPGQSEAPEDPEIEQWLRRIPDDPGGLLRRKFRLQYERREDRVAAGEQLW